MLTIGGAAGHIVMASLKNSPSTAEVKVRKFSIKLFYSKSLISICIYILNTSLHALLYKSGYMTLIRVHHHVSISINEVSH